MNNASTSIEPAEDHVDHTSVEHTSTVFIHPRVLIGALATAIVLTVGIAAASFWLSFGALRDLATMAGTEPGRAWVIPVVLDGAIVATTVTAIALSHHTDPRTVRGRRFVLCVLAVAAGASIAGNAYHATLTSTVMPAFVAAGIATIAPVFLLAMTEVLAVILRAPRASRAAATPLSQNVIECVPSPDSPGEVQSAPKSDNSAQQLSDLLDAHGALNDDVWETVYLYHKHPEVQGNFSAVSRMLEVTTSTVTRRYDKLVQLLMEVAATKVPNRALAPRDDSQDELGPVEPAAGVAVTHEARVGGYAEATR
ncbi:DUF2637 domain-containing protein [Rhodococcus sp. IEGM 1354]|uniref:DUF2637 domain-containing protein n=1 Tax=Rhodococcus sp. IEGM 1354 TaxID=3047088 RepID=UPI0024B7B024|nr:DUF2637 domain-containing protein [Rhodococcus sp. IEGM 1354]MDI9933356.1 DUF2637 domain-containing protein [Rhodococcus sp. IEGM 1354]